VKYALKVALFLGAFVLAIGILIEYVAPAQAASLGTVTFRSGAASSSAVVAYATNQTGNKATLNAHEIWVHVYDPDTTTGAINTRTTNVISTSDGTGLTITTTRICPTCNNNGVWTSTSYWFSGKLTLLTTTYADARAELKTKHGDTVTATYTDTSPPAGAAINVPTTLKIDAVGPKLDKLTPADGTIINSTDQATQVYSVEITDADSGVDTALAASGILTNSSDATTTAGIISVATTALKDSGGTEIGRKLSITLGLTGVQYVSAKGTDKAGNIAYFDTDGVTWTTSATKTMAKVIIDTDKPVFASAFTGVGFDTVKGEATVSKKNKITAVFTDGFADLDPDSISTSDFQVTGHSVTDAQVYDAVATSTANAEYAGGVAIVGLETLTPRRSVVLTLGEDMAPGSKPKVKIIGNGVKDKSGQSQDTGEKTPSDRISPSLTVSDISPTLAGKDGIVTFKITSDEVLNGDPTIVVTNLAGGTLTKTLVATTANKIWTVTLGKIVNSGTYSIRATAVDGDANAGSTGLAGTPLHGATGIVKFEGDAKLNSPLVTPANAATPTTRNPFFVRFDFSATSTAGEKAEDAEYTGDSSKTITITKLTLDGVDKLADVSTEDNQLFLLTVKNITSAEHTVVLNAKDAAGNALTADMTVKFTVKERTAFKISLKPGWNLISLPGDPTTTAINAVFSALPGVTDVVTFDPTVPGGTLNAVRDANGSLVGTLENITSGRAYWVNSDKFKNLEVPIAVLEAGQVAQLPPSIPIVEGWNLIPILDITGLKVAGNTVTPAAYLASIFANVTRVYSFDTIENLWTLVDHTTVKVTATTDDDTLAYGKGYFVYSTKKGNLVP
jgi:hypothetical protein